MRLTAGNDAPFRWAVKLQGKPFDLSGKDVKVYVINSRGEIPVARLTIEGHEVSGVFEGRYQTRLGEHSLVLRVNEGRPEMKTAAVANVFELVQWSAEAGGSDEGDVIVAPVLIESELSIGGGSSYDDTEVKNELARLEREKADKSELTELSAEVGKKQDTISDLETIRSGAAKGATAIQEVKTINGQSIVGKGDITIQGGGGGVSNEWKCVYDGRMEEGKSSIIYTTYADGTPLKAREAIIEVVNDIKAAADITGYVRIQSTLNKNKCSFGIITYESASVGDGKIMVQDVRIETSEHFFTKAYIAKDMKNAIAHSSVVGEEIGHNPQIFEDIVSIELASNLLFTEAAPLVKIYAR